MNRDEEERKTRHLSILNSLQLEDIKDTLIKDIPHPKQIMLQYVCCSLFIGRIALEIQSNRRIILIDNAFSEFTPDDYYIVWLIHSFIDSLIH